MLFYEPLYPLELRGSKPAITSQPDRIEPKLGLISLPFDVYMTGSVWSAE
jgi:hypothetical protein